MAEPYKRVFEFKPGHPITSVVIDEQEFMDLCDELSGIINLQTGERTADEQIQKLKEAKHIPSMGRGAKTQFVFDRYKIETDIAVFIVRGHGLELAKQLLSKL